MSTKEKEDMFAYETYFDDLEDDDFAEEIKVRKGAQSDSKFEEAMKTAKSWLDAAEQRHKLLLSNPMKNASQEEMVAFLEDYIYRFDGVSRQLEAAHNLIKKLKLVANDLQTQSV